MKKFTLLLYLAIYFTLTVFGQTELSNNYSDPSNIETLNSDIYCQYFYVPTLTEDLPTPVCNRDYPGSSSYFMFIIPESGKASINIKFNSKTFFGIALYSSEHGEWTEIKCNIFNDTTGTLYLHPDETNPGAEILVRFWKPINTGNGNFILNINDNVPSYPKNLAISTSTYTPQELVENIFITGCLTAENISYTGNSNAIGYFSNGIPGLDFNEGIIISSGDVADAAGPNTAGNTSTNYNGAGDSDLDAIALGDTHDAAVLEFDFTPATDMISFEYVFGSEEYPEYANSNFNDAFGLFISGGPESYSNENIALIPGTTIPVTINEVNDGEYSQYYVNNINGTNVEFDGLLVTLTAEAPVTACSTYHIKLAIADVGGFIYDSAVFLKANSFSSGENYTVESFNSYSDTLPLYRGCSHYIVFSRTDLDAIDQAVPIEISISGTATMGVDYSNIPTTLEIPAGEESLTYFFDAMAFDTPQGDETIIIDFENGCPCDANVTQHTITLVDPIELAPEISNNSPICQGDNATISLNLNTTSPEYISIEWSTGETNINQITVSPNISTTYSVDIIYPCNTITLTTDVEVIPIPIVDLGPDIDISGLTTNIDANMTAGNTGLWTFFVGPGNANISPDNTSSTTITVDELGLYTFIFTETTSESGCSSSDTIRINFDFNPTAEFSMSQTPCFGDNTTITYLGNVNPGITTFDWDFGDATIISGINEGPYIINFPTSGTHSVHLTVTEATNSISNIETITISSPLSGTIISYDDPCFESCQGSAIFTPEGGTTPYSYSWPSASNEIDNLCLGDYGLTVTDANDCEYTTNFSIDQPTLLEYDTIYNHVDCYGAFTGNANIIASGGTEPYTYIWSDGYIMSNHSNIQAGTYIPTVIDANGCSVSEVFVIEQPDLLQVTTSGDFEICENQNVDIIAQPMGGTMPYIFYWNNGDGNGFVEGEQTFQITPHEDILYTVYVEDLHGCTSNYATTDIIVSPTIYLNLTTEDNSCNGSCDGSAFVNINGGLQPFNYSWEPGGPAYDNLCAGLYTLTITDNIGCFADTMFIITEPSAMSLTMSVEDALCSYSEEGSASVVVINGTPPYSYLWANGNTTTNLTAAPGNYGLTITDDLGCRVYGEAEISAPEELVVSQLYNPTICIGGEAQVTAQASGGTPYYHFHWIGSDGSEILDDHQLEVSPEQTTTYNLTVTDDNGCSASGYSIDVNVHPPLSINHITTSVDNVCEGYGTTIELDISGGNGGPFQINVPYGDSSAIEVNPFIYYPTETTNLVFTVDDMCETPAVKDSIMIYVHEKPYVDFYADINEGCPGQQIPFHSLDTLENCEYIWDFGDEIFAFTKNPTHAYELDGQFDVQLTIIDEFGCVDSLTKDSIVDIWPKPYANFAAEPEIASILDPQIKFNNYSEDAIFYFWYYGDGDSTINFRHPIHFFDNMGEYEVMLVSENEYGCRDTATRNILIREEYTIWAPTAFSPNGDGVNDCFRLCGNGIDHHTFSMVIYNRWGELVFSTEEYNTDSDCTVCGFGSWDGTKGHHNKGDKYYPNGIYYWYATFTDTDAIGHNKQGIIQLIR